ncbi:MerR family transcriptional regulator [Streptomyces sp. P38-E01]|uniref:MerR family transcriptional regulator n=1 Tax=Streptomyces tardus TaxID=2780544 RepID=A0A949JE18_9ACTN|nr:MerR family transcriptional regulator [Streptomyces tardus]MBU7598337.1 MerR family transcriptional regulator [Streptomyces tardus]
MEWKVGELARQTGLTVRALHHYERIGLLEPSERTAGGHRLYDEADVARLYRIVTLRGLGLSLESVRTALDGELPLADLLRERLTQVDQQLDALRLTRSRLLLLADGERAHNSADLLALMEEAHTMDQKMGEYFSAEQLQAMQERRNEVGEEAVAAVEQEWPVLMAKVQAEIDAGTDPADPRAQALASRWMELVASFHGGDSALRDSLYRMQAENAEALAQNYGGPTPQMLSFIQHAQNTTP